ncbi:MAG: hypothetical protein WCD60_00195, partial [Pseudolabrys sp.]
MKAVLLTNHGGPEMLRYGEAPDPTAGPGEVVVDVYAASVPPTLRCGKEEGATRSTSSRISSVATFQASSVHLGSVS